MKPLCSLGYAVIALLLSSPVIKAANAAGYVNVTVNADVPICLTPHLLTGTDPAVGNRIDSVLRPATEGMEVSLLSGRQWVTNTFSDGEWSDPSMNLSPGEAAVVRSPTTTTFTVAGRLLQGNLKIYVPVGRSLVGSLVPQQGLISTTLQFPLVDGVRCFELTTNGDWSLVASVTNGGWSPSEPVLAVGRGCLVETSRAFVWSRDFTLPGGDSVPTLEFSVVPADQAVALGESVTLEGRVDGDRQVSYQWQREGRDIPGATQSELHLASVTLEDAGAYWLTAYDAEVWSRSPLAILRVIDPNRPRIAFRDAADGHVLEIGGPTNVLVELETSTDLVRWHTARSAVRLPAVVALDGGLADPMVFFRTRTP